MKRARWPAKFLLAFLLGLLAFAGTSHAADKPVVLFDQGHGQLFFADRGDSLDLSNLASLFEGEGFVVRIGKEPFNEKLLSGVDAVVISGPFRPLAPAEVDAVRTFLYRGGSLSIMLHIGQPLADLLQGLEIAFSNGVIHEQDGIIDGEPINFAVSYLKPHDLTKGLEGFNLYGGWALINTDDNSEIIAETGQAAWVDLNGDKKLSPGDAVQAFGVAIAGGFGQGRFVVFGDDAIFQNRFLEGPNVLLANNLVKWLKPLH
ncbi:MAG: DUF4350 domain-containing protein [Nitrospirota bacterium]|nr:DUF4350 domain-containing protein [Nitrospirota bacterium]